MRSMTLLLVFALMAGLGAVLLEMDLLPNHNAGTRTESRDCVTVGYEGDSTSDHYCTRPCRKASFPIVDGISTAASRRVSAISDRTKKTLPYLEGGH